MSGRYTKQELREQRAALAEREALLATGAGLLAGMNRAARRTKKGRAVVASYAEAKQAQAEALAAFNEETRTDD